MSLKDRRGISKILNRTNYRLLAWYFGPDKTRLSGLKNFALIYQSPMQSTGGEKFTCYVYYKTKKYDANDLATWTDSSDEDDSNENESDSENNEDSNKSKDEPAIDSKKTN